MAERYEINWNAVRAMRQAAVAANDLHTLHYMTERALAFALFSVHNQVTIGENMFRTWLAGGQVKGLGIHVRGAALVKPWVAENVTIEDLAGDDSLALVTKIVNTFPGVGTAKGTFTAALLGFPDAPCIDKWGFEHLHQIGVTTLKAVPGNLRRYRDLVDASPFRHTLDQWHFFHRVVKAFAIGQHDVWASAMLGEAALVAVA